MIRVRTTSRVPSFGVRGLGRFVLTLAALAVVMTAAVRPGAAAPSDDTPIVVQPPSGDVSVMPRRYIWATVEIVNGQARWAINGAKFSSDRVDLVAIDTKGGQVVHVVNGFFSTFGPTFKIVTNVRPCKGGDPVTGSYLITATDAATGLTSNTVKITTCS